MPATRTARQRNPSALSRPLRVMRVITRLNVGGPAYQAIYLTQRLQAPDFLSILMAGNVGPREGSMENLAAGRGVQFIRVSGLGREISFRSDAPTVVRIYRELRRFRPDIVHTHLAKAGAVGRLAARMARVPIVLHTYHGHVFRGYFTPRKTELFLRIERALARWTDRIIVLSEGQEREILDYGIGCPEQMVRIPLGLELEPFLAADQCRGRIRRELAVADDTPLIGIVARLVPIKAHDLFLQAASRVADRLPGARFLIIGDGELREQLEDQAVALGLRVVSDQCRSRPGRPAPRPEDPPARDAVVHFLGFRSDLVPLYADLDVVVVCSHNEGMPVAIIEALAASRPVVATDVGAVRELVLPGDTGILIPPGDDRSLADAILAQLAEPGRAAAMGRRGRERVYPRLSIDRLEQDIRRLYLDLASARGLCSTRRGADC